MNIPIHCLRAGALRICLAMMLGLLVVPGYVVAPILFAHAGSHALAGSLAGHIFHASNFGIMGLVMVATALWAWAGGTSRILWAMLLMLFLFVATNEFWIAHVIADLKAAMGLVDATPVDDPLRRQFGMWHGVSSVLHLISSFLTIGLLVSHEGHQGGKACSE